ncbi:hypothetical protein GQ44DRAFT_346390 [Phaeosphaeriaceae sp. PMI808]|nr:hypothetical protein GQ44DRAFT_346390 [Phaeosphaeriaceae sp. PMI808]
MEHEVIVAFLNCVKDGHTDFRNANIQVPFTDTQSKFFASTGYVCVALSAPQDSTVELFVQIVRNQLKSECKCKKTLDGLYEAYARAEVDEGEYTNGILRRASFRVWLAYWLASSGKHHFSGRTAQLRIFDTFNKLANEKKQSAEEMLAAIIPRAQVQSNASMEATMVIIPHPTSSWIENIS